MIENHMFAVGLCPTCLRATVNIHLMQLTRRAKPDGELLFKLINVCLAGAPDA